MKILLNAAAAETLRRRGKVYPTKYARYTDLLWHHIAIVPRSR